MHKHIRERRNTQLCRLKHQFCYAEAYRFIHDWQVLVVRWLFMSFSLDVLDLPIKKSDISVKYKRLLNHTHHKHEPQSSLA